MQDSVLVIVRRQDRADRLNRIAGRGTGLFFCGVGSTLLGRRFKAVLVADDITECDWKLLDLGHLVAETRILVGDGE